jgi:hypothetical protein
MMEQVSQSTVESNVSTFPSIGNSDSEYISEYMSEYSQNEENRQPNMQQNSNEIDANRKANARRRVNQLGAKKVFDEVTMPKHIQEILTRYGIVNIQDVSLLTLDDFKAMESGIKKWHFLMDFLSQ